MTETLVQKWQVKLDDEFPRGMIMTWDVPEEDSRWGVSYQISRIEVTGQQGFDPVVGLPCYGQNKFFSLRVLSYEVTKRVPSLTAHVTADNVAAPMWWSAGVSDALESRMSTDRQQFIEFMQEHGRSIYA